MKIRQIQWAIKRKYRQLLQQIDDALPFRCGRCGGWCRRGDMFPAQTTWGKWLEICPKCHKELYGD